mmetsp:Transcript_8896/g.11339  ORF Transcript_8896/g.11339 Transcript_8896/m.11339 type:complete len:84 (+) Transcript_8896:824-1075(+)|eukprot:CAMPEP_0185792248 /NCGR_PEP_ID=MMETSP1174-20130828/158828_1 /TAXON_ID=35687 /ORGANISM="Dictyocha speculum, Strain CCMP1381" /LENGTH=83 /DNA_ID=CAMNT_0028487293 /DNA_START=359 /DNA_END=610 /DNA_ORIENTATION=-
MAQYPGIDYSLVPDNRVAVGITGETPDSVVERARDFLDWLIERMQSEGQRAAAVATHSDAADERQRYFETGEMRNFWIRVEQE